MPPHATLRIKIPIEKEGARSPPPKKFSYVAAYLHNILAGNLVYTLTCNIYLDYEINKEPYSFTNSSGGKTTFMFGCIEEPYKMIGLLNAGSNYVKVYDDICGVFVPLYKRVYH